VSHATGYETMVARAVCGLSTNKLRAGVGKSASNAFVALVHWRRHAGAEVAVALRPNPRLRLAMVHAEIACGNFEAWFLPLLGFIRRWAHFRA
jgi:hypothetical protein